MQLTILVDNTTISHLYAEWGVSFYIEEEENKILFDLGTTDLFLQNAQKLGIDLSQLDYLAISHGHNDHIGGLEYLIKEYQKNGIDLEDRCTLIAHPNAFYAKIDANQEEFGSKFKEADLVNIFPLKLSKKPFWITDKLVFLGEIERTTTYENKRPIGRIVTPESVQADYLFEDTALAYKSSEGLVIITGCSHSGICNIIEYAKKVCAEDRVYDIIGGLHLINAAEEQLNCTLEYFKQIDPKELHTCHCTGFQAKIEIAQIANLKEAGAGLTLKY